jgi:hypothetical protein
MRSTLWRRCLPKLVVGILSSCAARDAPPSARDYGTSRSALTVMPNRIMNNREFQRPGRFDSQEEVTVAAYQNIVVAAYIDCTGLVIPRGGMIGWAFSTNLGDSWTDPGSQVPLPKVNNTDPGSKGDPALDVDANGNFYLVATYMLSGSPNSKLAVYKGRYNPVSQGIVWNTPTLASSGDIPDRPSIAIDRVTGYIYIAYAAPPATGISVVRSTDSGNSWEQPVKVSTNPMDNEPTLRVGPDGEVYIAWLTNHQVFPKQLLVRKSAQGQWPTFTQNTPTLVATVQRIQPSAQHGVPETPYTTMAIVSSGPARSRVYLVWSDGQFDSNPSPDGGFSAIAFSYSSDGSGWSAPRMVNDDGDPTVTKAHHWQPWTSGAPDGTVYVGWYDRRLRSNGCTMSCDFRTDVFAALFTATGGVSSNVRLTDQTFSMDVPSEPDCKSATFGEYNGAFATSDHFYFVWSDGRKGDPDAFAGGLVLP